MLPRTCVGLLLSCARRLDSAQSSCLASLAKFHRLATFCLANIFITAPSNHNCEIPGKRFGQLISTERYNNDVFELSPQPRATEGASCGAGPGPGGQLEHLFGWGFVFFYGVSLRQFSFRWLAPSVVRGCGLSSKTATRAPKEA